jgi:methionyl-tRNA formyltransferase
MRLVFCGTPDFAVPTFQALLGAGHSLQLVMTNPDEPRGRGYELSPSPVKQAAQNAGVDVYQPARLKDPAVQEFLQRLTCDALVVVAYGHIIPPWMIAWPRLGCVNLHASLLPRYRGAAPVNWALIRGETRTGVTTMKIDAGVDTGDLLLRREEEIREDDTARTLLNRLSRLGAGLMVETLEGLEAGRITPQPQDNSLATYAPILKKSDGLLDWQLTAPELARRVRGLQPWPVAYTYFRGQRLRIWKATPWTDSATRLPPPGTLQVADRNLLVGAAHNTALLLLELQAEGRKRMSAADFLNGMRVTSGERLGEVP